MGRSPCCDKLGLKKGPWTPEEDQKLLAYIDDHGHGNWRALPAKAGLQRCGKSCRLRWTNYLRPDIKRGKFSLQEEQTIIQLHALLGNRWSIIASHLPKRTDNEIKNYWNTHLKKRLAKMGIDPVTHKPENNALAASNGHSKNATNLSHIAQWESARLEAEARLAHQSKLRSNSLQTVELSRSSSSPAKTRHTHQPSPPPNYLDVPPACHGGGERDKATTVTEAAVSGGGCDLESSTSTLSFSENGPPPPPQLSTEGTGEGGAGMFEFMGNSEDAMVKEEGSDDEWKIFGNSTDTLPQYSDGLENSISFPSVIHDLTISMEGFAELLTSSSADRSLSNSDNGGGSGGDGGSDRGGARSDCYEDNKNYWNSILNLANSSPSNSPLL
ncbi:hypothetical protein Nepgr_017516 [Nepenthes gracilis]|uniref:Uncharacterized protein n=1 Tax=Nepenthes gracilis TaxID=150966 RepID=A0AAD3XTF2_NEPGR|nr:hypothetical protein Nepgr_017516 [Nepenthes gracilis]